MILLVQYLGHTKTQTRGFKMNYIIGSDKKTAKMAGELVAKIVASMDFGDFAEAEKLIDIGCAAVNLPFRAEFLAQAKQACLV